MTFLKRANTTVFYLPDHDCRFPQNTPRHLPSRCISIRVMATPKMQKRQTGQKSVHILLYLMMRGDMTPKKSASPETASLTVVFAHSGRSRGAQKRSSGTADRHTDRHTEMNPPPAGPRCCHAGTGTGGLQKVSRSRGFPPFTPTSGELSLVEIGSGIGREENITSK